ncbi:MAG: GlsB/YeaQ/YmgE family stress response membrane protein [Proteobacteria bacterium]|nr:GlsB/YeaQ/YmgE family stress response membrane protein [Pseudomonadota bacterium]MBU1060210.1 GlsB/YeaQ/YmgE family stress response membrane protein [Pseudomonadota bacterium]
MDINSLIIFLAIGALAGWLAGNIMKGRGFGVVGNILVGIVGAVLGGFVFSLLGLTASGLIGSIITATVGAVILLYIISIVKKA